MANNFRYKKEYSVLMKKGDRFFTIAYTTNTKIIEVEVIETEIVDGVLYAHFQNVEHTSDKWFKSFEEISKWKFNTREEAEIKLTEMKLDSI